MSKLPDEYYFKLKNYILNICSNYTKDEKELFIAMFYMPNDNIFNDAFSKYNGDLLSLSKYFKTFIENIKTRYTIIKTIDVSKHDFLKTAIEFSNRFRTPEEKSIVTNTIYIPDDKLFISKTSKLILKKEEIKFLANEYFHVPEYVIRSKHLEIQKYFNNLNYDVYPSNNIIIDENGFFTVVEKDLEEEKLKEEERLLNEINAFEKVYNNNRVFYFLDEKTDDNNVENDEPIEIKNKDLENTSEEDTVINAVDDQIKDKNNFEILSVENVNLLTFFSKKPLLKTSFFINNIEEIINTEDLNTCRMKLNEMKSFISTISSDLIDIIKTLDLIDNIDVLKEQLIKIKEIE